MWIKKKKKHRKITQENKKYTKFQIPNKELLRDLKSAFFVESDLLKKLELKNRKTL